MHVATDTRASSTPDLVAALERGRYDAAPVVRLELEDLDAGLTAIGDREDLAGPAERARLRRVRLELERAAAELLAE